MRKSFIEEAMASPWDDMDRCLKTTDYHSFRVLPNMDCEDRDYNSLVEYLQNH